MPRNIRSLLEKHGLLELSKARPNDYIGWITRAKLETTKQKRTQQMLDELKQGNLYMRMKWGRSK